MQGFPVSLVAAAFDSAGAIIAVIGLAVFAVSFAYQPVEVVVLVVGVAVTLCLFNLGDVLRDLFCSLV